MKTKLLALFLTICVVQIANSQSKKLSENAAISIITAGPGNALYEGFGHSAIRVKSVDFDWIYNYGFFDFNAPNFYLNFAKGKMLYKLEKYPFHYFVRSSQRDKRWIKEQVLNINLTEKQQFFEYLENNAKPENARYLYDPFFNNCATIIKEITDKILTDKVTFPTNTLSKKKSFRTLMNDEIPWNTWGSFGINLALGSKLDKIATAEQQMYLPDFVYSGFKSAKIKRNGITENLIKTERYILKFEEIKIKSSFFNPFLVFTLLLFIGGFITLLEFKSKKRTKWFDFFLFLTTGIIGFLILFLWFFTNHSTTAINLNFLWAFAPNAFMAFYLLKDNPKIRLTKYLKIQIVLLLVIPIIWITQLQQLPVASIPIIAVLLLRVVWLHKSLTAK
ncbi:MAG: DUF4105 domain-containing protein [Polaribacter sp.]|nr:DUF4105 domain-containing protein [Polaribacter sp.]